MGNEIFEMLIKVFKDNFHIFILHVVMGSIVTISFLYNNYKRSKGKEYGGPIHEVIMTIGTSVLIFNTLVFVTYLMNDL